MNKVYKFSELSLKAKENAVHDYFLGLPLIYDEDVDPITLDDCWDLIKDTEDDVFYNVNGEVVDEEAGEVINE